jgi:hypothetical protein
VLKNFRDEKEWLEVMHINPWLKEEMEINSQVSIFKVQEI